MGFFGNLFGSKDKIDVPQAPKLPTAQELFQGALGFGQQNFPEAIQARESAISDLGLGSEFYAGFQPTSFEEALASQHFQNVFPETERTIKHALSLSGIASSPILAEQLGKARGDLGVDIGTFLANQGNQRAQFDLSSRLGIDPNQILSPFVNTGATQGNQQAQLDYQRALMQYKIDLEEQAAGAQGLAGLGSLAGGGIGFALGGPAGAGFGASLGGNLGGAIGGGTSPVSFGDALSIYQATNSPGFVGGGGIQDLFKGYGKGTPPGTYDTGQYSRLPGLAQLVQ